MMSNEKTEQRINRLINKANQESEIISPILKRQMNPIIIQNNHTICFICQKEVAVDYCKTFSCNHLICIPCISKLIIKENFNFLSNKFEEKDILKVNINCFCGYGNISLDFNLMQRELNEAFLFNKPKDLKCHKHFEIATNYCFNCSKEICEKCIEEHKKELKKNKKLLGHKIIKIEECQKTKENFPKINLIDIENTISVSKNKILEFLTSEQQKLNDGIDKIINNLNNLKESYTTSFNQKSEFINKILDFFFSTYKLFQKECELDINELSMNNCKLMEGMHNFFQKIEYIPKTLDFSEKLTTEVEKITKDFKSMANFEYKLGFNYKVYSTHQELIGHKNSVNCLTVFQNKYIASGSSDNNINIWDGSLEGRRLKPIKKLSFHVDNINSIIAVDKENYLISSGRDDKLCLWDIKEILENKDKRIETADPSCFEQEQETEKILPKKYVFSESIAVYCLCPLSNGKIGIAGRDETIKIIDINLKQINTILISDKGPILSLAEFAENIIISGGADNFIKIYDISKKRCVCLDKYGGRKIQSQINCIIRLKLHNDSFASGGNDKIIKIFTYALDENKNKKIIKLNTKLEGHDGEIYCLLELLDGRIASGSADLTIKIWDLTNKTCLQTLVGQKNSILSLAQFNDGKLISGSEDKSIYIWD